MIGLGRMGESSRRRCISASARAERRITRTSCSQRCAINSAGTLRCRVPRERPQETE